MTSDALGHQFGRAINSRSGAWTSLIVIAVLALISLGMQSTADVVMAWQRALLVTLKAATAAPTLPSIGWAIPVAMGLLAIIVMRGMLIVFVLLAVEYMLAGPPRSWRNVGMALVLQAASLVFLVVAVAAAGKVIPTDGVVPPLLRLAGDQLPQLLQPFEPLIGAVLLLVTASFADYWAHRAMHAFRWLWRFHSVHHSVEDLDAANSFIHPVDLILSRLSMFIMTVVLQIDFIALELAVALMTFQGTLSHSRAPVNFGRLGAVLIDNRHHFIHHSILPEHRDKNFAVFFTFWDRAFGTYVAPATTQPATGLSDRVPPKSLWQFATGRLSKR